MPITETLKEHGRTNTITRQQVGVGIAGVWQFIQRCGARTAGGWGPPVPVSYEKRIKKLGTECEQMNGDALKMQRSLLACLTTG